MKNLSFPVFVLIGALVITASGQVKSGEAVDGQPASKPAAVGLSPANATRPRVLGEGRKTDSATQNIANARTLQAHAKVDFNDHVKASPHRGVISTPSDSSGGIAPIRSTTGSTNLNTVSAGNAAPSAAKSLANAATPVEILSSQVYRVGIHDVLDIQLANNHIRESTLFTVLDGGSLEYPLAGNPIPVAGLTTDEIAALLRERIKIFENPAVVVSVRDYASHTVTVTGFVGAPGLKVLRREAMPLYALLAESLALPEAARAIISRQGRQPIVVDFKDPNFSSTLVVPGDAIKVAGPAPGPTEFLFIGGSINSPGQKPYYAGLTLTQAILASGGLTRSSGAHVRISRQGTDGRLVTEEYNLRKIQTGKVPDPDLQKGDRIEVTGTS